MPRVTREICKNWFFKIASIRELLPRIYVEAALLRCRSFLSMRWGWVGRVTVCHCLSLLAFRGSDTTHPIEYLASPLLTTLCSCRDIEEGLNRLSAQTRGVGDPLVCIYARCYLARVGCLALDSIHPRVSKLNPRKSHLLTLSPHHLSALCIVLCIAQYTLMASLPSRWA